jgi:hypothetical protein
LHDVVFDHRIEREQRAAAALHVLEDCLGLALRECVLWAEHEHRVALLGDGGLAQRVERFELDVVVAQRVLDRHQRALLLVVEADLAVTAGHADLRRAAAQHLHDRAGHRLLGLDVDLDRLVTGHRAELEAHEIVAVDMPLLVAQRDDRGDVDHRLTHLVDALLDAEALREDLELARLAVGVDVAHDHVRRGSLVALEQLFGVLEGRLVARHEDVDRDVFLEVLEHALGLVRERVHAGACQVEPVVVPERQVVDHEQDGDQQRCGRNPERLIFARAGCGARRGLGRLVIGHY